jgi:hypothetical protein
VAFSLDLDKTLVHPVVIYAALPTLVSVPLHIAGFRAALLLFHLAECRLVALSSFADITEVGEFGRLLVVFRDSLVKCALAHLYLRMSRLPLVKQLELRIIQISRSDNTSARREKGVRLYPSWITPTASQPSIVTHLFLEL